MTRLAPMLACASLLLTSTGARSEGLLVGVLSEQHQQRCLRGRQEWVDPHDEVGFVWLASSAARAKAWSSLRGKLVVAHGRFATGFKPPKVAHSGECPEAQMRSDMVWARSGFRLRRSGSASMNPRAFEATHVKAFTGLSVSRAGAEVKVAFKNTLGRPLEEVVLTLHYEGCYGKPGSRQREHRVAALASHATASAVFPTMDATPGPPGAARVHHAYSLQVSAAASTVHFDLDRNLSDEGISIPCPPRGQR